MAVMRDASDAKEEENKRRTYMLPAAPRIGFLIISHQHACLAAGLTYSGVPTYLLFNPQGPTCKQAPEPGAFELGRCLGRSKASTGRQLGASGPQEQVGCTPCSDEYSPCLQRSHTGLSAMRPPLAPQNPGMHFAHGTRHSQRGKKVLPCHGLLELTHAARN
jgi:hypothetical protein